jgi:hypothetical protein
MSQANDKKALKLSANPKLTGRKEMQKHTVFKHVKLKT